MYKRQAGNVGTFSDPQLDDSIIWHNRQFYFFVDTASGCVPGDAACTSTYGLCPDPTGALDCAGTGLSPNPDPPYYQTTSIVYDDLGVIGAAGSLVCDSPSCIDSTGSDPLFVREYANGARSSVFQPEFTTAIQVAPAFDEGGNFINPRFGPLSINVDLDPAVTGIDVSNYHLTGQTSPVGNSVYLQFPTLFLDFDAVLRPLGSAVEVGADEIAAIVAP